MRSDERHHFLGDHIRRVGRGEIGIAAFQRPFRWTKRDVEAFLLSVTDDVPIGSLLTWVLTDEQRNSGLLSKGRVGPVIHDSAVKTLVLDGQNRLSTVIWAARRPEAPDDPCCPYSPEEVEAWLSDDVLVADLEERRMHFVPSSAARGPKRFPLGEIMAATLLNLTRPLDMLAATEAVGISDGDFNWFFDDIPSFFRTKKVVVSELSHATADEAFEVFLRVCRTGQPITDEDVAAARAWIAPALKAKD